MSAPPMAAVVVKPLIKLRTVFTPRYAAATAGTIGAAVTNAPIAARFVASSDPLMRCLPGRASGREDILPASFKNATTEPVKVTPPDQMNTVNTPI